MFKDLLKSFSGLQKQSQLSINDIALLLKTNPETLLAFENAYQKAEFENGVSDNLFKINSKQISAIRKEELADIPIDETIVRKIVNELIAQTQVFSYNRNDNTIFINDYTYMLPDEEHVTKEEITALPTEMQPDLTGNMMKRDIPDSGRNLASTWSRYLSEKDPRKKSQLYHHFRQGLDILDVDNLTYAMINTNPNSMGNWLPYIIEPVINGDFFKIPSTKIVKLPITLLQLTRQDYMQLSKTTMKIVNEYCKTVFELNETENYFVKTGTYSSKFDFRNAYITGPKEIAELGEYLLFNHWSALQMAHYDLTGRKQPVIYGVSTTTEWVVREFIPDTENNLTIYHGLPLRTEYRAFVDFDKNTILTIHPYWDPNVMEKNFAKKINTDIDAKHDYMTYLANKDILMQRYNDNEPIVKKHLLDILPNINLHGQWSIDIMQNGTDFYIIDMALAENSAFYETVPKELRLPSKENWLPTIMNK